MTAAEHIIALGSRMPYDNNKAAGFEITDLGDPVTTIDFVFKDGSDSILAKA